MICKKSEAQRGLVGWPDPLCPSHPSLLLRVFGDRQHPPSLPAWVLGLILISRSDSSPSASGGWVHGHPLIGLMQTERVHRGCSGLCAH